jgi:ribokinase
VNAAPRIAVVGSCNMDISAFVERAPERGETVSGSSSKTSPGGKGANQAIAAARLGGSVSFIGAVGDDGYGRALRSAFADAGVDTSQLRTVEQETGTALIVVEQSGANRIVVISGANATVTSLTPADRELIEVSSFLLLQLESPLEVVIEAAQVARGAGTAVVLTPAPARPLPDELLRCVDVLVPNEHEALLVAGSDDLEPAIDVLGSQVPVLVVTLGERGGIRVADGVREAFAAPIVDAVDTTAAGDTFVGALTVALAAEHSSWPELLERASAAAAISVGRAGASESMPTAADVDRFLGR